MNSKTLLATYLLVAISIPLHAQSGLGKITGSITDSSGSSVPGAIVSARESRTGQIHNATSNVTGVYVITPLPLGTYAIDVKKEGFKAVSRTNLIIDVNTGLTIDVVLEPGSVSEKITVEATGAVIQTENASIGNSRYEVQIKNLPVIVREIQIRIVQQVVLNERLQLPPHGFLVHTVSSYKVRRTKSSITAYRGLPLANP